MQYIKLGIQGRGYPVSVWAVWALAMPEKDSIRGRWTRRIPGEFSKGGWSWEEFFDTHSRLSRAEPAETVCRGRILRELAVERMWQFTVKFLPPRAWREAETALQDSSILSHMMDKSLQNLGMDYVDLYIYHMWDYGTPLYEIMEGAECCGKSREEARYIGISNCFAWQLAKQDALAERKDLPKVYPSRGHYNPDFPGRKGREMVPYCRERTLR